MKLPNKELINAITNEECISIGYMIDKKHVIVQFAMFDDIINIDELAQLCKEYILKEGYCINSLCRTNDLGTITLLYGEELDYNKTFDWKKSLQTESEAEAIFDAAAWILERRLK